MQFLESAISKLSSFRAYCVFLSIHSTNENQLKEIKEVISSIDMIHKQCHDYHEERKTAK